MMMMMMMMMLAILMILKWSVDDNKIGEDAAMLQKYTVQRVQLLMAVMKHLVKLNMFVITILMIMRQM